nr:ATP-binding cassette domain-containing protein [Paenibacillus brevis]
MQEVSKSYSGEASAVEAVSVHIREGSIHGIIGPSGAGKSTLLRIMNVLERPDRGSVLVDGQNLMQMAEADLRSLRRQMGMVFQQFHLLHNRTVSGNVAIPLEMAGEPKKSRAERIQECLRFVGLEDKAQEYPSSLSGGQKQRVAIARALAPRPRVLLCDEPTSSLDPATTMEVLNVLKHANESLGVTIVIVTHEMEVIRAVCNEVTVMDQGRIVDSFPLEQAQTQGLGTVLSYREQLLGKAVMPGD